MKLRLEEIIKASGGRLLSGSPDTIITSFSTDSREIGAGTMFVPIKGERMDSHKFIPAVFEGGAAASFSEEEIAAEGAVVLVKDSRKALQEVAAYYRSGFDIPIIGVTGSVGKTTTKEMIALALSAGLNVMKTRENANSQVGVPITICNLSAENQAAVVEMGVSLPGEMEKISAVVKATHAVVTNIGVSHIEYLKSRENIMAEKLKIADYITDGAVFVNGDDDLLSTLKETIARRAITFGLSPDCDWRAENLRAENGGTRFSCKRGGRTLDVFVPAPGEHNVRNALVSLAVAEELGVKLEDALLAIASYEPLEGRQRIFALNGCTVIDDTYNASTDSMKAAVDILAGRAGRKIAVLGDMLELGDYTEAGHREVGEYAHEKGVDILIGIGERSRDICRGFGKSKAIHLDTNEKAAEWLKTELKEGDNLLVKGSRGMKMEEIINELRRG